MAGPALTTAATMMCPHGGTVSAVASSPRASAGATLLTSSDTFAIAGCPFVTPAAVPSPCVSVTWTVPDMQVKRGGSPTLSTGSVGLCLNALSAPQGPVVIAATQPRVSTR
jgi:hypothetical protein